MSLAGSWADRLGDEMSQKDAKFPELYALERSFFQDLLSLLRSRFGDPPQWPTTDFYDIQFGKGSAQYRSFSTPAAKRANHAAALYSIWGSEAVSLASFEPLMGQLRSLVDAKKVHTTYLDSSFLIPFVKQYLTLSCPCTFDEGLFEKVYKMGEEFLSKQAVTGKLYMELAGLKADMDELVLSPHHRILRLDEDAAKRIWTLATSGEFPELVLFRQAAPALIPGDIVLEATFHVNSAKLNEAPLVRSWESRACALAFRLCEPGGGRIEPIAEEYEPLVPSFARQQPFHGSTPGVFLYAIDAHVASRFKQSWSTCYAFASELVRDDPTLPIPLKMAGKRFAGSFGKWGHEDKLIDYVIAKEALLGKDNEAIAYRVALRLATLIGNNPEERVRIFTIAKRSYDSRSKLVHGSGQAGNGVRVKGSEIPWAGFLLEVEGYLIRCLRIFMKARDRAVNKETVLAMVERAIVSQDRTELERQLCELGGEAGKTEVTNNCSG